MSMSMGARFTQSVGLFITLFFLRRNTNTREGTETKKQTREATNKQTKNLFVTVLSRFCHGCCLAKIENHWFSIGFTTKMGVTVSSRLSRFRHGFDFHVFLGFPLVL